MLNAKIFKQNFCNPFTSNFLLVLPQYVFEHIDMLLFTHGFYVFFKL